MTNEQIYAKANLTPEEVADMSVFLGDGGDFFESTAFEKLFEYFAFDTGEMPYGTAKARTGVRLALA